MKTILWLVFVCIPLVLAVIMMTVAFAYGSPGSAQLYWKWGRNTGQFHNGSLAGPPTAFTFTSANATCNGSGIIDGPATLDCTGDGWTWHASGLIGKRPGGFVFSGSGHGVHGGNVNDFVEYISLGTVGTP